MGSLEQTKTGNLIIEGNLITGGLKMTAGAGADKVLTTDASGIASWQTAAGGEDTWITTQTCGIDHVLQSVGKTTKTCINKVDYSDVTYDLWCTDCIGPTEITDKYVLNTGDAMTGALAMGNNKITGLGTPSASTDAATKGYVDDAVGEGYSICIRGVGQGYTCPVGYDTIFNTTAFGCQEAPAGWIYGLGDYGVTTKILGQFEVEQFGGYDTISVFPECYPYKPLSESLNCVACGLNGSPAYSSGYYACCK